MGVDAGTIYSEVRVKLDKLTGDVKGIETNFGTMEKTITGRMDNIEKSVDKNFSNINLAGVAAFAGITLAVKNSIKTFATFEQSLLNVKSVSGATADEFQKIEDAAREAGETTRFTASEAADALYFLASAGFDATQSVKALDGVLTLAGATQSDLAFTSETVASAISQFSLDAEDAGRVANVFAAGIANSQATMEKLSTAMRQVGPIAGALGISIEETTGALQVLFKAGLRGEQAGTALRNILSDLANTTSPVVQKLNALGVSFDQVNPQTNSLADIMGVLNEKGITTTKALSIFGKEAGSGIASLLTAGRDAINEYTDAVTGTNAAAQAYAIQNEGLLASFDFLKSAAQEVSISFTEEVSPALQLLTDLITGFLRVISKLPGPVKAVITSFVIAIPVLVGVTTAIGALSTAIGALSLSISGLVTGGAIISGLVIGIKAVSDTLAELDATSTIDELIKVQKAGKEATGALKLLENRLDILGVSADKFKSLKEETGKTGKELVRLANIIKRGFDLSSIDGLTKGITVLSEQQGIAQESLLKLIIASDNFSESQKTIAEKMLAQNEALAKQETHKKNIAQLNTEIISENDRILQLEKNINDAVSAGILSESEGLEQKIKLRQDIIDKLQQQAVEEGNTGKVAQNNLNENLKALQLYKDELSKTEANKVAISEAEKYEKRLKNINSETETALQAERRRANELIDGLKAGEVETKRAKDAIKELFDELEKTESTEAFKANLQTTMLSSISAISQLFGALDSLQQATAQKRIEALNNELSTQLEAIEEQKNARLEALGLVEETELETLQRQLEEAIAIGDEATAADIEKNITKLQIEKEAEEESTRLKEEAAKREAQIEYQAELQSWKLTLAQTIANGIGAVVATYNNAGGFPWGVAPAAIMTGVYTTLLKGVQKSKPTPPQMAEGGIILPGSGGTIVEAAENGYPEAMINYGPSGQALIQELANKIVNAMGGTGGVMNITFETDGLKQAQGVVKYINNGNVRVKL